MSWSVQATGRTEGVVTEITTQFDKHSVCMEPEESVRQAAKVVLLAALAGQDPTVVVTVKASGHMSKEYETNKNRNQLQISVEPVYGFIG